MVGPLAQTTINPILVAIVFTVTTFPVGLVIGYLLGYRYKGRYQRLARELANLKGENFRGELTRVGIPQGQAARAVPLPSGAEKLAQAREVERELRALLAERTAERDQIAAELRTLRDEIAQGLAQPSPPKAAADGASTAGSEPHVRSGEPRNGSATVQPTPTTGTEAWQLAQLHREQVALQLRLDDYRQQVEQLLEQRDQWQRQASTAATDFEQLRQLLAEQEALIASVERERDSLATRLSQLE